MKKRKNANNLKKIITLVLIIIVVIVTGKYFYKKNKSQISNIENQSEINEEYKKENIQEDNKTLDIQKSDLEQRLSTGKYLSTDGLPVLMYHFFYDENKTEGKDENWIEISNFEEQMKYLADNDFYFPTWKEVEDYIDEKTELPEKSVVITVDDGDTSFFELAVPIIQKYNIQATSFVVAYWYGDRAENKEKNISYQSHSYDMHKGGANGKGVMLSWSYDKIVDDLKTSQEVLGDATVFCYPFGQFNDLDVKALKDTGFKLAFTTQGGRVKKGASKYQLPRVRVSKSTSLKAFMQKVE